MSLVFIISAIYFYLPGAFANMGATFGRFIPFFKDLTQPVDRGIKYRGIQLVGDHKKLGSFLFGALFGILFALFKVFVLDNYFQDFLLLEQSPMKNMILYTIISFGAVTGDLIKSFFKRQLKITPHSAWIPFDEIDHTTTSLLLVKIFFPISWLAISTIIFIYLFLHAGANVLGFLIGVKKVPY